MLLLTLSAFAMDCAGLHPFACDTTNHQAALLETASGTRHISDAAAAVRLRTETLYMHNLELTSSMDDAGCVVEFVDAGTYGNGRFEGLVESVHLSEQRGLHGQIRPASQSFVGTYDGGERLGEFHAFYTQDGRFLSQRDTVDRQVAGHWIRIAGRRGVFVGYEGGTCPEAAEVALGDWLHDVSCIENTFYRDADDDGFGDAAHPKTACDRPAGYALQASDCDDSRPEAYPGAPEWCDGVQTDCHIAGWTTADEPPLTQELTADGSLTNHTDFPPAVAEAATWWVCGNDVLMPFDPNGHEDHPNVTASMTIRSPNGVTGTTRTGNEFWVDGDVVFRDVDHHADHSMFIEGDLELHNMTTSSASLDFAFWMPRGEGRRLTIENVTDTSLRLANVRDAAAVVISDSALGFVNANGKGAFVASVSNTTLENGLGLSRGEVQLDHVVVRGPLSLVNSTTGTSITHSTIACGGERVLTLGEVGGSPRDHTWSHSTFTDCTIETSLSTHLVISDSTIDYTGAGYAFANSRGSVLVRDSAVDIATTAPHDLRTWTTESLGWVGSFTFEGVTTPMSQIQVEEHDSGWNTRTLDADAGMFAFHCPGATCL